MKTALRIASVLSWFNLIFWGLVAVSSIFLATVLGMVALVLAILLCSIPLNSYAALQLHKSIRHPAVKLSHQTPAGIRFVGFVALFFGLVIVANNVAVVFHPEALTDALRQSLEQAGGKETFKITAGLARGVLLFQLIAGLAVVVNVLLNFRLLRWYYLVRKSDAS